MLLWEDQYMHEHNMDKGEMEVYQQGVVDRNPKLCLFLWIIYRIRDEIVDHLSALSLPRIRASPSRFGIGLQTLKVEAITAIP